jgi:hypothetical protein
MSSDNAETAGAQQPAQNPWSETENLAGVLVEVDGPVDTTIRPARPALRPWIRPDQPPPRQNPSDGK